MPRGGILITCNFVAAKRAQKKTTKGLKCVGGAGVSTKKDAPDFLLMKPSEDTANEVAELLGLINSVVV